MFGQRFQSAKICSARNMLGRSATRPGVYSDRNLLGQESTQPGVYSDRNLLSQDSTQPGVYSAKNLLGQESARPRFYSAKDQYSTKNRKYNLIKIRLIKWRSTQIRNLRITLQVRKYPYFLSSVRSLIRKELKASRRINTKRENES